MKGAYLISGMGWDRDGTGTGQFWKMRVPNFQDAGTVTEIPTCLKSGITENLSCLRSEIKLYSSVAMQDSHPGSSVQCTVLLAIARWGEGATETVGETKILAFESKRSDF